MDSQNKLYNLPSDPDHLGLLKKFQELKFKVLKGREPIKGKDSNGIPPDEYVSSFHRLHDLIRGFYKPKMLDCLLSYQATEKIANYGEQIEWEDYDLGTFIRINMSPPSGKNDSRANSDINAARTAMSRRYPIGILHNQKKGINRILGLGLITEETSDGVFVVKPLEVDFFDDQLYNVVIQDIQSDMIQNGEMDLNDSSDGNIEGRMITYYGKRYERDAKNRSLAIKIHGCVCAACKFDFNEKYGELGKDFIEVHHKNPISNHNGQLVKIDPKTDLIPLCSNCHSMVHRNPYQVLTVDELVEIIKKNESDISINQSKNSKEKIE